MGIYHCMLICCLSYLLDFMCKMFFFHSWNLFNDLDFYFVLFLNFVECAVTMSGASLAYVWASKLAIKYLYLGSCACVPQFWNCLELNGSYLLKEIFRVHCKLFREDLRCLCFSHTYTKNRSQTFRTYLLHTGLNVKDLSRNCGMAYDGVTKHLERKKQLNTLKHRVYL